MMRKTVYSIFFTKLSKKQYDDFSKKVQREVALVVEEIARNLLMGKPLQGTLMGLRSKRVGKFRIVYQNKKKELIVLIINIEHRKSVYKMKKR